MGVYVVTSSLQGLFTKSFTKKFGRGKPFWQCLGKTLGAVTARFAPYLFILINAICSACEKPMFAFNENKTYGV